MGPKWMRFGFSDSCIQEAENLLVTVYLLLAFCLIRVWFLNEIRSKICQSHLYASDFLQMKYSVQSQHFVKDHFGPRRKTIQAVAQNECNIIRL